MNRERLLHIARLTNNAKPDTVVHTGDFLTHRSGEFDAPLYEALARSNRLTVGIIDRARRERVVKF
jgi:hypothetical protein